MLETNQHENATVAEQADDEIHFTDAIVIIQLYYVIFVEKWRVNY